uniref:C-type lectin domain-containing protein n=1 Tax=Neolamprologus brichardi TaxID=32507 RepID=A0A3Q4HVI3_NEOBR
GQVKSCRDHIISDVVTPHHYRVLKGSFLPADKTCPVGWSKFNHRCYLQSERSDSWDAARKNCTDEEADLIVIDSPEEETFLSTIINEQTWIGLNDKEQEGTWKWVDGTPPTLMYWASSQPDDGGDEDCAYVRNHGKNSWMDFRCSASFHWICEKTLNCSTVY